MKLRESPRLINLFVGLWLCVSAFVWPHRQAQVVNALAVGTTCALAAYAARRVPQLRVINILLALWLFASSWVLSPLGHAPLTRWNHLVSSSLMLFVALLPERARGWA